LYNKRMDLVIDTSAVIAVIANEPERPAIVEHTVDAKVMAPASVHWEVGNAFTAMFKQRRISLVQARQAIRSYERMLLRFVDIDLGQSVEMSYRLGLYAYDAYVLACALNFRLPLLTLDGDLVTAAPEVGVQVLEVGS
jgi:predicted nucleic acid-binding protein